MKRIMPNKRNERLKVVKYQANTNAHLSAQTMDLIVIVVSGRNNICNNIHTKRRKMHD